jgi:tRNA(fMet)-specific endonuclease VapC
VTVKRYLLDTNIISAMMVNADGVVGRRAERVLRQPQQMELCTSIVVLCELRYGLARRASARLNAALEVQLASLLVLPLDLAVVAHHAQLRTTLEAQGTPIGPHDTLIAAHALALNATLVSGDAEFTRVPGLDVENWLNPDPMASAPLAP